MADAKPFQPAELADRRAAVGRRLAEEELDACVVLGPEAQLWLCGSTRSSAASYRRPRTVFGHGTPTGRVLEPGDLVHVEIS